MGVGLAIWVLGLSTALAQDGFGPWSRSMALGGEPKYAAGFKHFDYVSGQPQMGENCDWPPWGALTSSIPLP